MHHGGNFTRWKSAPKIPICKALYAVGTMNLKQTSELFLLLSAFILTSAIFPQQFGVIYSGTQLVLAGIILSAIGLVISFPVSPDFNRALAFSLGSFFLYFALCLLIAFVGFCIFSSIKFFTLASFVYCILVLVSVSAGAFFKARGRLW